MSFVIKEETGDILEGLTIDGEMVTADDNMGMELDPSEINQIESEDGLATIEAEDMEGMLVQEMETIDVVEKKKNVVVPPLRPLTIAPKPSKVPISFKPMAGQQLLLVQGGSPGQQIKLISSGQGLNLANLQLATKQVRTTKTTGNTISLMQQPSKQLVMKKVMTQMPKTVIADAKTGQQIMVVQKSEPQMKIVQSSSITTSGAKTLTLAQAQQMGIISGTKIVSQSMGGGTKQIVLNKNQQKTIKIVPQLKSPTKILPAPQTGKMTQRIILKPATSAATLPSQIVVSGSSTLNSGQLHQINIPGKGMQYIKFVTTTQTDATASTIASTKSVSAKMVPITSTGSVKGGNIVLSEIKGKAPPKMAKVVSTSSTLRPVSLSLTTNAAGNQVVVLPAAYVQRTAPKVAIPAIRHSTPTKISGSSGDAVVPSVSAQSSPELNMESNGMRPRKPCNCTKSQCLKLYCDCFANGEFCYMCNCMNCFNNLENEEHRQRAIKNCLERNPNAFRPKIGKAKDYGESVIRKHTKGCNCKRSGCLKNYCECYEAKIACSSNCKCKGCRNLEDLFDRKPDRSSLLSDSSFSRSPQASSRKSIGADTNFVTRTKKAINTKLAFNYITNEVIEATSQCLLTMSTNAEESNQDQEVTKREIIEEFGRCLKQIIDCSISKGLQVTKAS